MARGGGGAGSEELEADDAQEEPGGCAEAKGEEGLTSECAEEDIYEAVCGSVTVLFPQKMLFESERL